MRALLDAGGLVLRTDGDVAELAHRRLLIAVLISAALHLSLMFGVAVRRPSVPVLAEPIVARIGSTGPAQGARAQRPTAPVARPHRSVAPVARPRPDTSSEGAAAPTALVPVTPVPADALPPVEMPLLTDPTWYPTAQLDVFPRALAAVQPVYPEAAASANAGGTVTVLLLIDEHGYVHEGTVVDAQPEGMFEESALQALLAARFSPGGKDGRSVRSRVLVNVVFNPTGAGH